MIEKINRARLTQLAIRQPRPTIDRANDERIPARTNQEMVLGRTGKLARNGTLGKFESSIQRGHERPTINRVAPLKTDR
jgi:hypothetical protein